jgi:HTH-type transcriptional regulator, competence development regulator
VIQKTEMANLGKKLRDLRRKSGLTQHELAEQVGVDDSYISKIENDRLPYPPSGETLRLLARVLRADPLELLAVADRTPKEFAGFSDNPDAYEFLQTAARYDLRKSDWQALKQVLEQRLGRSSRTGEKESK